MKRSIKNEREEKEGANRVNERGKENENAQVNGIKLLLIISKLSFYIIHIYYQLIN